MSDYYKTIKIPVRIIGYPKRKRKKFFPQTFKIASVLFLLFSVIIFQTGIFSAYEAHVVNVTAHICNYSEIRSCGYWKNHSNVYKKLLPQTLGGYPNDEIVSTVSQADKILTSGCGNCGCGCDKSMRAKLKGQLLAMKFNIAYFGIGEYLVESEGKTLNEIVAEADNLLRQNPPPPDSVLEKMKDLLDYLNNLEKIRFCAIVLPPKGCILQLTKTANVNEINPGQIITYHLTFDNVGDEVCTGGGVRLKDIFNKNHLQYINYISSRNPKWFSLGSGYLEWNFGSIYPEDPLIEIDLKMKVKENVSCNNFVENFAKYWSDQTDWGELVSAKTKVVCQKKEAIVVINEFLPNPVGPDKAKKPHGEWIELYNKGNADIDVAGWVLYDNNDGHELYITPENTNTGNTLLPVGGFLVVYRNGDSGFALNNIGGDSVRLYNGEINKGAKLIDSYTYTINALEGKSFARIPDGSDNWQDPLPTPGEPNIADAGEMIFAEASPEEGEEGYEETIIEGIEKEIKEETPDSIIKNDNSSSSEESFKAEEINEENSALGLEKAIKKEEEFKEESEEQLPNEEQSPMTLIDQPIIIEERTIDLLDNNLEINLNNQG